MRSWSAGHGYRTSYRDMTKKKNCGTKNYAIPKYTGHIVGMEGNSELGAGYTTVTRTCYMKDAASAFDKTQNRFRSTGFGEDTQ